MVSVSHWPQTPPYSAIFNTNHPPPTSNTPRLLLQLLRAVHRLRLVPLRLSRSSPDRRHTSAMGQCLRQRHLFLFHLRRHPHLSQQHNLLCPQHRRRFQLFFRSFCPEQQHRARCYYSKVSCGVQSEHVVGECDDAIYWRGSGGVLFEWSHESLCEDCASEQFGREGLCICESF